MWSPQHACWVWEHMGRLLFKLPPWDMWRGQDPLTCQTAPFVISMHHALLRETSEHCNRSWWSVSKQLHERKTNNVHLETVNILNRMEQNKLLYMVVQNHVNLHFIMCLMGKTEPSCLNYGLLCVCMRVSLHVHVCLSISYNVESFCWKKNTFPDWLLALWFLLLSLALLSVSSA